MRLHQALLSLTSSLLVLSGGHAFSTPINNGKSFVARSTNSVQLHMKNVPDSSSSNRKFPSSSTLNAATLERTETETIEQEQKAEAAKSYLDDGFVFGLEGSGLERPKGKVASVVVEGDDLETKPYQVAMVLGTFLAHAGFATTSFMELVGQNGGNVPLTVLQSAILVLSSWILADFGSGVLHWSVDNYGNGRTPIMGSIIAAFQGHHSAPWTITQRGFCNNVYKLCIPFGIVPMTLISLLTGPATTLFLTIFCVMEILSQEFHKWSHMTKGEVPSWVNWLQDVGITIPRVPHALHHTAPYDGNYCIISGICNEPLDKFGVFRRMEHIVYKLNGVESNVWKLDPQMRERTLRGEYGIPQQKKK
mmetsp:Transcript_20948/g.29566  ORF Transcript_20948/g.29566 Transcript_20948/m.29566 type:complete len:363 (+) Transcript_20948:145-1233(+)